ncbi:hypothetical protein [Nocardioides sp. P5_E3]
MLKLLSRIPIQSRKGVASGLMSVAGIATLFGFGMFMMGSVSTEEKCTGHLWAKECTEIAIPLSERLPFLLIGVGLGVVVLGCMLSALYLSSTQGHLKSYQAILTGVESMSIQRLASIANSNPSKVRREVQAMIDSDMIDDFYIDYGTDQVVSKKYIPKTSYKTVVTCRSCGANNELIVGITRPCAACGEPLVLNRP